MLLLQEQIIPTGYLHIRVSSLYLVEDNLTINNTIKIQDNFIDFDVNLGNILLTIDNEQTATVMV